MSYCKLVEKIPSGLPTVTERKFFTDFGRVKEKKLHQKTLKGHHGCVNALGIGAQETLLSSGGDDLKVFIWHIQDILLDEKPKPRAVMETLHTSNVFSTNFTPSGNRLISTGNDGNIIVHDVQTGKQITCYNIFPDFPFLGGASIATYSSAVMPEDENIFVVCSENPEVNVYDIRCPAKEINSWTFGADTFSVDFHPNGRVFAIAGKKRLGVIDFRNGQDIYENTWRPWLRPKGATHAKWSPSGGGLAVIRPCNIPIFIDLHDNKLTYLSDMSNNYHTRNTVKSCEFIDEDTVVTGSENFDIFMWHISNGEPCDIDDLPDTAHLHDISHDCYDMKKTEPYMRLRGHRSIPNIMKYSPKNGALFSSGVEKIIKTWTAYTFPGSTTNPPLRNPGDFRLPMDDGEHDSDSSEDLEVLSHFDRMIVSPGLLLSEIEDFLNDIGDIVTESFEMASSEHDSDSDVDMIGVLDELETDRSSSTNSTSRSSSPEAVPIRRMVNNEPVDVDSDDESDGVADDTEMTG